MVGACSCVYGPRRRFYWHSAAKHHTKYTYSALDCFISLFRLCFRCIYILQTHFSAIFPVPYFIRFSQNVRQLCAPLNMYICPHSLHSDILLWCVWSLYE